MKKDKLKFFLIKGTVYPFDVLVTTANDEEVFNYIENNKKYKLNDEEKSLLEIHGNGKTTMLLGGQVIVRLKKAKTSIAIELDVLSHELNHAVFFVFDRVGIKHTMDSDEAFCYYQQYLLKEVLKLID